MENVTKTVVCTLVLSVLFQTKSFLLDFFLDIFFIVIR